MSNNRIERIASALLNTLTYGIVREGDHGPVEEFDGFRLKEAIMAEIEAAEARGSGWRPIATAPKDREVLMYFPTNPDSPVGIGWWTQQWEMQSLGIPHIDDHLGKYFHFPTHWMPLPDPPKAEP